MGVFALATIVLTMAKLKTQKTKGSVSEFLKGVDKARQADCKTIVKMMSKATNSKPAMWGESIIGFGEDHLVYASGRELDWFKIGFSPRKGKISLYCMCNTPSFSQLLKQLGPHKTGKGCLYIKSLKEIDLDILQQLFHISSNTQEGGCACS